jgi:hypothetical protein
VLTASHRRMFTGLIALLPAALLVGAPAGGAATGPPVVSSFTLKPLTLHPGTRASFRFLTSREGSASIAIARLAGNARVVTVGRLRFGVDAGPGTRRFDGRLDGKALRPGRYRATVTVQNADTGTSAPRQVTFRITEG